MGVALAPGDPASFVGGFDSAKKGVEDLRNAMREMDNKTCGYSISVDEIAKNYGISMAYKKFLGQGVWKSRGYYAIYSGVFDSLIELNISNALDTIQEYCNKKGYKLMSGPRSYGLRPHGSLTGHNIMLGYINGHNEAMCF